MDGLKFIGISQTGKKKSRTSCFAVEDNQLRVTGILPHGYTWRPTTALDRRMFVEWLWSLQY